MNDDADIDDNFDDIEAVKHQPAAPPPAPAQTIGGDTRTPEEIRSVPGYKWLADWFARGEAARQPRTIEERFYGPKR
jgi:hypothetical protein